MTYRNIESIYHKPWLIEREAALSYLSLLEQIKAGKSLPFKKPTSQRKFFAYNADVATAPIHQRFAKEHPGYDGKTLAILPVTGALMKEDVCGWFGTASLRGELDKINATESIKTIVLHIDSPGGTVDGTQALAEAVKASDKEVIAVIDGMMCSAAYWIGSSADKVIATAQTDIIGSIGTMISFYDASDYEAERGIVLREYTADASKDKNRMFSEARKGNGKLLIQELLNPLNDIFLAAVRANRGAKLNEKETLSGKTFLSEKALEYGLIDSVSSFNTTINNILKQHSKTTISMSTSKWTKFLAAIGLATLSADKSELKDEHLDTVEASLAELETTKADLVTAQARVQELETAATASQDKITGLEAQVTALTTERDNLKAEVEKLGKLDAGRITTATSEGDKFNDGKQDPATMDFQQELLSKV